jgi:hypothetical protein
VLERDQRTVETWQRCISKKSDKFHTFICTLLTLNLLFLHKDELWSYLGKKQKQRWGFIGFEVDSRVWINVELGSRTTQLATMADAMILEWVKKIKDKATSATDLNTLQEDLLGMYGDLPTEDLTKVMALAFAAADLAGRFDVNQEAHN